MNSVHLHLLLNHIPVLGALGLLVLLAIAFMRRDSSLARITFALSVVLAAMAAATFLTGEPAEEAVERIAGIAERAVEPHEEAALLATIAFGVLGAAALLALVRYRRTDVPRWVTGSALVATVMVAALMGWTANLGGRIRHTEIVAGTAAPSDTWGEERDDDDHPPGRDR